MCGHISSPQLEGQLLKGKPNSGKSLLGMVFKHKDKYVKCLLLFIITTRLARFCPWKPLNGYMSTLSGITISWQLTYPRSRLKLTFRELDISNTQILSDSPAFLNCIYCSQEVVPLWVHIILLRSGPGGRKREECLNGQINEQSEGRLCIPIQVVGKCLSVVWWKGLDLGPEGESGSTCPLPPAARGLKNNEESARQRHVGGSWLHLIENRPFVLFSVNVYWGLHSWGCKVGRGGHCIHVCMCETKPSFFAFQSTLFTQ